MLNVVRELLSGVFTFRNRKSLINRRTRFPHRNPLAHHGLCADIAPSGILALSRSGWQVGHVAARFSCSEVFYDQHSGRDNRYA
ncbi:hypothetical protein BURKHO8Y_110143 [Burkholderia sp. 8Y]|nr:hypothetical protein BURKHO8Y_110143 [Burkholderia sp. 8Y]